MPQMPSIPGDPAERVAIRMQVTDWVGVDITMDSTGSNATEDQDFADLPRGGKADAIRDLGHKQIPWRKGNKWPPDDQWITMTLTRAQWTFVLREMYFWLNVNPFSTDPEAVAANTADRKTIARIESQLIDPTRSSPGRPGPGKATKAGTGYAAEAYANQVWLAPFDGSPAFDDSWTPDRLLGVDDGAIVLLTGVYWGKVDVRIRALGSAPPPLVDSLDGWEVGEEETLRIDQPLYLFNPLAVDWVEDAFVPARAGLYRVRVLAHGRLPDHELGETTRTTGERYEITIWPVTSKQPRARAGADRLGAQP